MTGFVIVSSSFSHMPLPLVFRSSFGYLEEEEEDEEEDEDEEEEEDTPP